MSWDDIKENKDSEFMKLEVGAPVRVHIIGEPEKHIRHFVNKKALPCIQPGCLQCAAGDKRRITFTTPVFNMGAKRQQILDAGIMVYRQIKEIRKAYNDDLATVDLLISREGSGQMDTRYTVVPIPTQFKPEMLAEPEPVKDVPF